MTRDGEKSVLSRWSRRKLETQAAETQAPAPAQPEPDADQDRALDSDNKPVLTDADMPDIDRLNEASDFSPFMSAGVSDELRNLALRKLFKAPVFNIRDGLDEYDEDYTSFEKLGDIVTSDMKHQIEVQQQKLREKLAREGAADADEAFDESAPVEDEDAVEPPPEEVAAAQSDMAAGQDSEHGQ